MHARASMLAAWGALVVAAAGAAYVRFQLLQRTESHVLLGVGLTGFVALLCMSMVYRETYHRLNDAGR